MNITGGGDDAMKTERWREWHNRRCHEKL